MTEFGKPWTWRATGAPLDSALTEDIWFASPQTGWAVNSSGQILRTDDAGDSWQQQACMEDAYLRCIAFAGVKTGWVGALNPERRLLRTRDGGVSWDQIELPSQAPRRVTAICAVNPRTLVIAGTTYADEGTVIAGSSDGGEAWTAVDMRRLAATLHDMLFIDPRNGWAVGGIATDAAGRSESMLPAILRTEDGGATWRHALPPDDMRGRGLPGEIASRIARIGATGLVVALTSPDHAAVLRSDDAGGSWRRLPIGTGQKNIGGVGFLDGDRGWVGGCGDYTFVGGESMSTSDGGQSWQPERDLHRLSRIRFVGRRPSIGYAAGDTIYKLSTVDAPRRKASNSRRALRAIEATTVASIDLSVPAGVHALSITCWERDGRIVRTILKEQEPAAGDRVVSWDLTDATAAVVADGLYVLRITIDRRSTSRIVFKSS